MLPARLQSTLAPVALVVAAALVGVLLWPQLPSEMAIHFDASGTPDNYVSKPVGVFLAPAIGLGAILFVRAKMVVDDVATNPAAAQFSMLFTGAVIFYVHILVLLWNLGYRIDTTTMVIPPVVGAAVFLWYQFRLTS